MTTAQFTSPFDSDTDANFRAWGSEISTQLAAVGLTQTADTGQIDWTTASISGYPGSVGYEIWRFNDSLQGTTPIFVRIDYGATGAEAPYMAITVGTGSNGAGTINGATKSNLQNIAVASSPVASIAYPSWICYNPALGFLGVALKLGINSNSEWGIGFLINRTADTSGAPTADGFNTWCLNQIGQSMYGQFQNPGQVIRLPTDGSFVAVNTTGWPMGLPSSFAGGNTQAVPLFQLQPAIQVAANMCMVIRNEVPNGTTFSLNIVGLTPRTFVSISNALGYTAAQNTGTYGLAMLYQ